MADQIRVQVIGNDRVAAQFRSLGLKVRDLSDAFDRIANEVASDAVPMTPFLTGRLVNSIRPGKTKTMAVVRAGYQSRVPYAAVIHYGGYHNIEPHPFLTESLIANRDFARDEIEREVERLINRVGLG